MIQTAGRHQFFRANDSECFKQLASNKVYPTFTPRGGQVRRPHTLASCKPCQERLVSTIGRSAGVKHPRAPVQLLNCWERAQGPRFFGNSARGSGGGRDPRSEGKTQQDGLGRGSMPAKNPII